MALGFTFNNTHSGTMGVVFRSVDRTLLPAKRVTQYTIPGKSGTYDIEDGYQNREISCAVSFIAVTGKCPVTFLCGPFAESLDYNQQAVNSVSLPHTEKINVNGSQATDCLIYITARGRITDLTVTRIKID